MNLDIVPAAEAGWTAVEAVFTEVAPARSCWCQFHILPNTEAKHTTRDSRRELLAEQVASLDPPRGLIAIDDGQPAGWCGVEPRRRLRHVLTTRLVSRHSKHPPDDPGVWAVYCLLVPPGRRRRGVASAMLSAALDHARDHGGIAVEGLPIDTSVRGGEMPPGFSTGTLDMFEREGFSTIASLPSGRTLVYRRLP